MTAQLVSEAIQAKQRVRWIHFAGILAISILTSCRPSNDLSGNEPNKVVVGPSPVPANKTRNILVKWVDNREKAVNQPGGGYRVYYSAKKGFDLGSANSLDVPYVSGSSAPVSATLDNLSPGTYYIKVLAYSALNVDGGSHGSVSSPSAEISISVP